MGKTYFQKVFDDHIIEDLGDGEYLIHIDRNFVHELSGAIAFKSMDENGRKVRNSDLNFATIDHVVDTEPGRGMTSKIPGGNDFMRELSQRVGKHDVRFFGLDDPAQGIVHVIAPELGIALPGLTFTCSDSHTCTIGGIGAYALGIGSTDSEHILATQTMIQVRPKSMRVRFTGRLSPGVYPKDLILSLIGSRGTAGGNGYTVEYAGEVIESMSIEGRLTMCNMAVEFGARSGMVAPDERTFEYLEGRPYTPKGADWERAVAYWKTLRSDADAVYDLDFEIDATALAPQVTWGTSPEHVIGIDERIPDPSTITSEVLRKSRERALGYIGLQPGDALLGQKIDGVFIGSCINSRLSDLRVAAGILRGHKIAPGIKAICTPGSQAVKRAAEAEGLHEVFLDAGFEWRESGCSLCMSGNAGGEKFEPEARVIATTNRNFEDRQGPKVRSHLASPATVAASALTGCIADARSLESH